MTSDEAVEKLRKLQSKPYGIEQSASDAIDTILSHSDEASLNVARLLTSCEFPREPDMEEAMTRARAFLDGMETGRVAYSLMYQLREEKAHAEAKREPEEEWDDAQKAAFAFHGYRPELSLAQNIVNLVANLHAMNDKLGEEYRRGVREGAEAERARTERIVTEEWPFDFAANTRVRDEILRRLRASEEPTPYRVDRTDW